MTVAVDTFAEADTQVSTGGSLFRAQGWPDSYQRESRKLQIEHASADDGSIGSPQDTIMHREIKRDQVRAQVLIGQYRTALTQLNCKDTSIDKSIVKQPGDDRRGLSKKERKKLKKKNKKIEKSQKKKEEKKVIVSLVNFHPEKVRIKTIPLKKVMKSKWANFLIDFRRSRSLQAESAQDPLIERKTKSVNCTINLFSYSRNCEGSGSQSVLQRLHQRNSVRRIFEF